MLQRPQQQRGVNWSYSKTASKNNGLQK